MLNGDVDGWDNKVAKFKGELRREGILNKPLDTSLVDMMLNIKPLLYVDKTQGVKNELSKERMKMYAEPIANYLDAVISIANPDSSFETSAYNRQFIRALGYGLDIEVDETSEKSFDIKGRYNYDNINSDNSYVSNLILHKNMVKVFDPNYFFENESSAESYERLSKLGSFYFRVGFDDELRPLLDKVHQQVAEWADEYEANSEEDEGDENEVNIDPYAVEHLEMNIDNICDEEITQIHNKLKQFIPDYTRYQVIEDITGSALMLQPMKLKDISFTEYVNNLSTIINTTLDARPVDNLLSYLYKGCDVDENKFYESSEEYTPNYEIKENRVKTQYTQSKDMPNIESNVINTTPSKELFNKSKLSKNDAGARLRSLMPNIGDISFLENDISDPSEFKSYYGQQTEYLEIDAPDVAKSYGLVGHSAAVKSQRMAEQGVYLEKNQEAISKLYNYDTVTDIGYLMTMGGYYYCDGLQENASGVGSFMRLVTACAPITSGNQTYRRYENKTDGYRDYDNLKVGDTITMNAQHFTCGDSFKGNAERMFGEGNAAEFIVKGRAPMLNLSPYVRKDKKISEVEYLSAGCYKITNINKTPSKTSYEIEFDWDKWEDYVNQNAKLYAQNIGLYHNINKNKEENK